MRIEWHISENPGVRVMPAGIFEYDREAAVSYAHQWALGRNPAYYDYEKIGGDCTNFASQCVFAGAGVMNMKHVLGWYYVNANNKSPSWTGVSFLKEFLTGNRGTGPFGAEVSVAEIMPGDIVQLSFNGKEFQHSPVVVQTGERPDVDNILIAAHSYDCDYRPLNTYSYQRARFIHVFGVRR